MDTYVPRTVWIGRELPVLAKPPEPIVVAVAPVAPLPDLPAELVRLLANVSRAGIAVGRQRELNHMQGITGKTASTRKQLTKAELTLTNYLKGILK